MYEKQFFEENKGYCIAVAVMFAVCIFGAWVCYDNARNEPVYNSTDDTMDRINERLSAVESRVNSMQTRLDNATQTVSGTIVTIRESRENAERIETGIGQVEARLDSAIQRSGRITNIIADIEAKHNERTKDTQTPGVAK